MPLTLNQFLLLVITFAVVIAVTFLVVLFVQLRRAAKEGEKTLQEIKALAGDLRKTSQSVNEKIDDLDSVMEITKKTLGYLSEITLFLSTKIIKPSSKYWPFLFPLIRFSWRQMKKKKEGKNGK